MDSFTFTDEELVAELKKYDLSISPQNFVDIKNCLSSMLTTEVNNSRTTLNKSYVLKERNSSEGNTILRKVMWKDKSTTEEFVTPRFSISSICSRSNIKSNSSSISQSENTDETTNSSSIESSDSAENSSRHSESKVVVRRTKNKKCDPVSRYHYYKKFWDEFKPPGEKDHSKLRWTIRDKMLEYNL